MGLTSTIAKKVGGRAAEQALEDLAIRFADVTRNAISVVVETRGPALAAEADVFRLRHPGLDQRALERALGRDRARRGGAAGLATGLPSVVVGPGTAVEVAAALADAAALTYAQVSLIIQLGHLRGLDVRDVHARRLDVLFVFGIETGVVKRDGDRLVYEGQTLELSQEPDEVVGKVTREIGEMVISKIARRRARALLGRLIPLGVGVAIAGLEDYRGVSSIGKTAIRYLDLRRPVPKP
jgi:hypothetical protein